VVEPELVAAQGTETERVATAGLVVPASVDFRSLAAEVPRIRKVEEEEEATAGEAVAQAVEEEVGVARL
jgi:hypothetical protein